MPTLARSRALAALCSVLFLFGAVQIASAQDSDPVVAKVNGKEILRSEVLASAANLPPQMRAQAEELLPVLLERLVDIQLITEAASAEGLETDEEVIERLAEVKKEVMRQIYLERLVEQEVTDEKLQARYDDFIAANPPEQQVKARHILVEDEAVAKEIIEALDGGADFAELAGERSIGPSGPRGGDLGYFTSGTMVPAFSEAAFALEPGSYTAEPVQTQFGWHVILVEDKRDSPVPSLDEMREQLTEELTRSIFQDKLTELRDSADIEIIQPEE